LPKEVFNAGITGVGSYLPERILTNTDLEEMVDTTEDWIVARTGIKERRIALPEQATSDLALIAGERALADAGVSPAELDLVIVATDTPDTIFPSTACLVQDKLGANKAAAFDLAAGCTGFVYALVTGSQFIISGLYRNVLVIGAECLSRIVNWQDRKTCVLFGDGAGAVLLSPVPQGSGLLSSVLRSDGSKGPTLVVPAGGSRLPADKETVEQKLHTIQMDGPEVFKFAVRVMSQVSLEVLSDAGLHSSDIDFFIPHQANIRIIESAARRLDLPMEKVLINLDRYGNTSAASIPIAVAEAVHNGRITKGDHIVMMGFGAGLTWGAAVVKW
jgi:3-oxoacyl-[acyl-carrier-protein] synthase-3